MILAHRIQLKPNQAQTTLFKKTCGVCRRAWNDGLNWWQKEYEEGGSPSGYSLCKIWNKEKPEWAREVCSQASQRVFSNLQDAFNRFFKGASKYPSFKSKGRCRDSFYVPGLRVRTDGKRVRLPKIGWVRMTEALRFEGKIVNATVSREADRWFISINVETEHTPAHGEEEIGVDLGVRTTATLSTGEKFVGPKPLAKTLKKLQRLSRQHSRKQKGSNNRRKSAMRLARHYRKIKNIRRDFLHKTTSMIVSKAKSVYIEDLSVEGMKDTNGRGMRRAISDIGMGEFRRQLTYKCQMNEVDLIVADRYFPSTKLCYNCGTTNHVGRSQTTYSCHCGYTADRDVNAAKNLLTVQSTGIHACGERQLDEAGTTFERAETCSETLSLSSCLPSYQPQQWLKNPTWSESRRLTRGPTKGNRR